MPEWKVNVNIPLEVYVEDPDNDMSMNEIKERAKAITIDYLYDVLDTFDATDIVKIKSIVLYNEEEEEE